MKKLFLFIVLALGIATANAQSSDKVYVYGVDFTYAKVYAADESVEHFARAFEGINMLIVTEPNKYDFSRIVGQRVETILEPMIKVVTSCNYANLKTLNSTYDNPDYAAIVKSYELPQSEGVGVVLIAKFLNKPMAKASYELITFDINTREIIYQREVEGEAGGFGLKNYWARTVYEITKSVKISK